MKISNIIFILLILSLYSCKTKRNQQFEKDIVGEWNFIKRQDFRKPNTNNELPPLPPGGNGYIFYQDNRCEYKSGYFKIIEVEEYRGKRVIDLGNKTQYKIDDDSLKVFDLSDSTWQSEKIFSIIGDTLTFQKRDSVFIKYARAKYNLNPKETYDKIIVSSFGCFGSCSIMDISIDKNGKVLFFGEEYTLKNGFFSSKITEREFQNILANFKKAEIQNLKDDYQAGSTDNATVTIVFIKDDKIVKSITDYGEESPSEFIWAYRQVEYLYQHIKLVPLKEDNLNLSTWGRGFEKGQDVCRLSKAETFYLLTEILNGKEFFGSNELKYKFQYWNKQNKKETIYSDGRFFKFSDKTIDIGYNFLTKNNLRKRFNSK